MTSHTIGLGQLKTGIVSTNELDLFADKSVYFGGGFKFIMDTTGKNWVIECVKTIDNSILTDIENIKASVSNVTNSTEFTALTTRVTTAEDKLVTISDLYYESDNEPNFDLKNWRFWHNLHRDGTTVTSKLYYRSVKFNDAVLMNESVYSIPLTPDLSVQLPNGNFELGMGNNTTFTYTTARTNVLNNLSFPANTYTSISWYYLDSSKNPIRTTALSIRAESIQPTDTVKGLGAIDAPANAAFMHIDLSKADGSKVIYDYPLA
jgi:hypothetical protein